MATIYISYSWADKELVHDVGEFLKARGHHLVWDVDTVGLGDDWRDALHDGLKAADIFCVFISKASLGSGFVLGELGAARFLSKESDRPALLPVIIDDVDIPKMIGDLRFVCEPGRDPEKLFGELDRIASAIIDRQSTLPQPRSGEAKPIKLFVSHAHRPEDQEIADQLVSALVVGLVVPPGAIRCTSVPGYKLDLGTMAPDVLRAELDATECIVGIITPNSIASEWVLFELGASWGKEKTVIPLLAGGLKDADIPGPLRGAAGGQLTDPASLDQFFDQMKALLGWAETNRQAASGKLDKLSRYVSGMSFFEDDVEREIQASFVSKRARIGGTQNRILDHITHERRDRPYIPQEEIYKAFSKTSTHLYYRLEQLRYLGFLTRQEIGKRGGLPNYGWSLSERYKTDLRG